MRDSYPYNIFQILYGITITILQFNAAACPEFIWGGGELKI